MQTISIDLFKKAPRIIDRSSVVIPLLTGLIVLDVIYPIGRGQRQLILGDKNTGKRNKRYEKSKLPDHYLLPFFNNYKNCSLKIT